MTSSGESFINSLPFPLKIPGTPYSFISFFKVPQTPYPDGGGYLGTSLYNDLFGFIEIPTFPSFFNTSTVNKNSIFQQTNVRYISMASYGASVATDNVIAGEETKVTSSGKGYYFLLPQRVAQAVFLKNKLNPNDSCRNLNFLAVQANGKVGDNPIPPYIILREKVQDDNFSGKFSNVPLYPDVFANMTPELRPQYSAITHINEYAPRGIQCSKEQFESNCCADGYASMGTLLQSKGLSSLTKSPGSKLTGSEFTASCSQVKKCLNSVLSQK